MPDVAPPSSFWRRHRFALVASIVIAGACVALMSAGALPVVPPAAAFAETRWWAVALYAGIWTAVLCLRSVRWYWLLAPIERVPMRRVLTISFVAYGALVVLPFRLGEFVRPALARKRAGISMLAATGTVGAERIIDGLVLSSLLLVALPFSGMLDPLPGRIGQLEVPVSMVPSAAYSALAVFIAAFVAMGLFYYRRDWARRWTERCIGVVSTRLARALANAVERLASGLGFLPRWSYSGPFLLLTLAYWSLNVAGVQLLMVAVGLEPVTYMRAAVVTGVLALGILVPNAPGFFGSFQLSVYAGLAMFYASSDVTGRGAAFVFLLYGIQMALVLLGAVVAAMLERMTPAAVTKLEPLAADRP